MPNSFIVSLGVVSPAEFLVERRDVHGDALGVAPRGVVGERDVDARRRMRSCPRRNASRFVSDVDQVVAHREHAALVGDRTVSRHDDRRRRARRCSRRRRSSSHRPAQRIGCAFDEQDVAGEDHASSEARGRSCRRACAPARPASAGRVCSRPCRSSAPSKVRVGGVCVILRSGTHRSSAEELADLDPALRRLLHQRRHHAAAIRARVLRRVALRRNDLGALDQLVAVAVVAVVVRVHQLTDLRASALRAASRPASRRQPQIESVSTSNASFAVARSAPHCSIPSRRPAAATRIRRDRDRRVLSRRVGY